MRSSLALLLALLPGCGVALPAAAPFADLDTLRSPETSGLDWDTVFRSTREAARPLHFVARYADAHGTHRLEEWRQGSAHLRRLTDARIDLHADAVAVSEADQPVEYVWQIVDREKKIDHRISTQGMLRAGMIYSFYAMAHVLTRPSGRFRLERLPGGPVLRVSGASCTWYSLKPEAQPESRICWAPELGVPLQIANRSADRVGTTVFQIGSFDHKAQLNATYEVDTTGLQVRNVDQLADDD